MAKSKIYVGLEIGTSKTCMVVGEVKADNSVKILGVGETKTAGVRKGEISDMANVRTCVRQALLEAEDVCDVDIRSVFLSVTGSHILGVNNRGTFRLPDEDQEITTEHMEEAKEIARDIAIPSDNVYLHNIVRQYLIDGNEQASNPIGLLGRTLDADFHIVHGVKNRIQNSIKCVREIPLDVDDVVFAPIASAQIALNRQDKDSGALVIDIGGGTTDYVMYLNGAVAASGCIPVGGDHVTNDIHLVTQMPLSKAEKVKCTEGDASGDPARSVGTVTIPDDKGFPDLEIKRQLLNDIIRGRLEETLQLVKAKLPDGAMEKIQTGVFLTGGTSLMRGFGELANDVFKLPVYRPEQPEVSGIHEYFRDPQYSTAVGLIRYAQLMDEDRPREKGGVFGKLAKVIWPF
ncbi:cell division protein FtsA [Rubritalea spongiae]|uniref:Cell division protein FtsA n=1 Tax=Rubritalea spongiae TaxID=430797 RepID=A0ABW5E5A7_9BACT